MRLTPMIEGDLSSSRNSGRSASQVLARIPSVPSLDVEVFMWTRDRTLKVIVAVLGVFTCAASVLAGDDGRDGNDRRARGGNVLPASAHPKGYSLSDIAAATAAYNVGPSTAPPNVPFEILVGDTTVKPGTMIYLPIFFADDSTTPSGSRIPHAYQR